MSNISSIFNSMDISLSALQAQRKHMDVIGSNLANADSTNFNKTGKPYQRQIVTFETILSDETNQSNSNAGGVSVTSTVADASPSIAVPMPGHPDAVNGIVMFPNVKPPEEMADLMSASRAYEANSAAMKIAKNMFQRALEIGKA